MPRLSRLEDRTLLSGGVPDLSASASPLSPGTPVVRHIAPSGADYYKIESGAGGKLTVQLAASGFPARVSLVDGAGRPLIRSDGPSAGSSDWIDMSIPAGAAYLEVESLGGEGMYELDARWVAATPAFRTIPSSSGLGLAVADFDGDGIPDVATADGVRLGVGDGTFRDPIAYAPPTGDAFIAQAIVAGRFGGGLPGLAVLGFESSTGAQSVRLWRGLGGGRFEGSGSISLGIGGGAIGAVDLGGGQVLAVLDRSAGRLTLYGAGEGGPLAGVQELDAGGAAISIASGRSADGRDLLAIARASDPQAGTAPGVSIFREDAEGQFRPAGIVPLGTDPRGMVAGDFNGDGRADLVVAGDDSVTLFLDDGAGGFRAAGGGDVGSLPDDLIAADLDGDRKLDLVTANRYSSNLSVLLGNGDGTFRPQARIGAGVIPSVLATADLDRDGRPDLLVGNLGSGDVSVVLGRGDGSFQGDAANPVVASPRSSATADLDRDGHRDLIVVEHDSGDVSILLGNGDGTFRPAGTFAAGTGPDSVVVGDFNGDGRPDLAVACEGDRLGEGGGVSVLLGNGDGTFRQFTRYLDGSNATSLAIFDVDVDGGHRLDLAAVDPVAGALTILRGTGSGDFTASPSLDLSGPGLNSAFVVAGDFAGDGGIDLAVMENGLTTAVSIFEGDGRGGFEGLEPYELELTLFSSVTDFASGDFDDDGRDDLAVLVFDFDGSSVRLLRNLGGGRFDARQATLPDPSAQPQSLAVGDFDDDGDLDIAVTEPFSARVDLFWGDGSGGLEAEVGTVSQGEGQPATVAAGDFDGDGKADLAIGRQGVNSVSVLLSRGGGSFADPEPEELSARNTPLVADLDGDGVLDVSIVDGAGNILFRRGRAGEPGVYDPPITINAGLPSRDIAAVVTGQGTFLASVDAADPHVSLFGDRAGRFTLMRTLDTGLRPAQVVSADLHGRGAATDLVIRNAGDGTVTIYLGGLLDISPTRIDLAVGAGISDLSLADVDGDGLPDLLLAGRPGGTAEVMLNLGGGAFAPPTVYRAGAGLLAVTVGADGTSLSVASREEPAGVVAAALTRGGPVDLVTVNPGSATLGVLRALGDGRFSNPTSLQTGGRASIARAGDFNGDGLADLAILGTDGLVIRLGDGRGALFPSDPEDVGPDPTGLTIADVNGDGTPDLVVGNAAGDVLTLLGDGRGAFRPPVTPPRAAVSLAAADLEGEGTPTFVFANRSLDRVVVRTGDSASPATVLGDRSSGLILPGSPVLADLNGDNIPDLVVANSGGNSVLIYPGLGGGAFGPEAEGGSGFFTGTGPASVVAADVDGDRVPDLIVADEGSNDVSVLLNRSTGSGFSFSNGPRLRVGAGPTSVAYGDVDGDGISDISVSDGGSSDVTVLQGLGRGFFNDTTPKIIPLSQSPGAILPGDFGDGPGLVTVNPGTRNVTLITGLATGSPTTRVFSSGGLDPVAALAVRGPDGFDDLVVANRGDGSVSLLSGGPGGLSVEQTVSSPSVPSPSSLALASIRGGDLEVYAATEGQELATLIVFSLEGVPSSATLGGGGGPTLLPSRDSSLPLIATFLTTFVNLNPYAEGAPGASGDAEADAADATASSVGQSLKPTPADDEQGDDEEVLAEVDDLTLPTVDPDEIPPWLRSVLGLDEAFDGFRLDDPKEPVPAPMPAPAAPSSPRALAPMEGRGLDVGPGDRGLPARPGVIDAALDAMAEDARPGPEIGFDGPPPRWPTPPRVELEPDQAPPLAEVIALGGILLTAWRPGRIPGLRRARLILDTSRGKRGASA